LIDREMFRVPQTTKQSPV